MITDGGKQIYCFDLDGTICTMSPNGDLESVKPHVDRIKKINKLYDEGHTIVVETARGSRTGIDWFDFTENQLIGWGLKFHTLRTGEKVYADHYIDDKAINDKDFFK